jgi:hypothetical protein
VAHTPELAIAPDGKIRVYYVLDPPMAAPLLRVWREVDANVYATHTVMTLNSYSADQVFIGRGVGVKGMPGNSKR